MRSCVVLAMAARERTGTGTAVEVSCRHRAQFAGPARGQCGYVQATCRAGSGSAHPNIAPYDKFAASDGEIFLGILNDGQCPPLLRRWRARTCSYVRAYAPMPGPAPACHSSRSELETHRPAQVNDICVDLMRAVIPAGARQHMWRRRSRSPCWANRDM